MRQGSVAVLILASAALLLAAPASASVQPIGSAGNAARLGDDLFITIPAFTAVAGTHRLLVVSTANGASGAGRSVTSVTFGETALTKAVDVGGANTTFAEIWVLPLGTSTTATTADIKVTYNGNIIGSASAQVFRGVRQTDPVTSNTSTSFTAGVLSAAGNYVADSVVMAAGVGVSAITPSTQGAVKFGGVQAGDFGVSTGAGYRTGFTVTPNNQPTSLSWTFTSGTDPQWAHAIVNIIQLPDADNDSIENSLDNCPSTSNTNQANNDGDSQGDACDADDDNDGVADSTDNCDFVVNGDQANSDADASGNACDADDDNDTILDGPDNCDVDANTDQVNTDDDPDGDACDFDDDNDTVADATDNCRTIVNTDQANLEGDAFGDLCDLDDDNDAADDTADNCPALANAEQVNTDGDAQGDTCDADDDNDSVPDSSDAFPLDATRSTAAITPVTPAVTAVRLAATRFSRRTGTKLTFTLNTAAQLTITSKGTRKGRRKGRKCSTSARRGKRCTIRHKPVTVTFARGAGTTTVAFGRGLKPGKYTARIVGTGPTGLASAAVVVRFTVR